MALKGLRRSRADVAVVAPTRGNELDDLIAYGHAALAARGAAPLALQLDAALRLAGLHLRRSALVTADNEGGNEDARWAVTLASFVVDRGRSMPPAALLELVSRAVAVLELAATEVAPDEQTRVRALCTEARANLRRAEEMYSGALEDAIANFAIGQTFVTEGRKPDGIPAVRERVEQLLASAVITARAVGEPALADAALTVLRAGAAEPEKPGKKRGRRKKG
jgi:hypothetical protein